MVVKIKFQVAGRVFVADFDDWDEAIKFLVELKSHDTECLLDVSGLQGDVLELQGDALELQGCANELF